MYGNNSIAKPKVPNRSSLKGEMKQAAVSFATSTSVKGISRAMKAESIPLKIIWILGALAGLGLGLYLICNITISYFRFETVTKITDCVTCKPSFPDVTVCNLNVLASLAEYNNLTYEEYEYMLDETARGLSLNEYEEDFLYELYTTIAYLQNIDTSSVDSGGLNVLVHDCTW